MNRERAFVFGKGHSLPSSASLHLSDGSGDETSPEEGEGASGHLVSRVSRQTHIPMHG